MSCRGPHIHVEYGGDEVVVRLDTLRPTRGTLPRRATALLVEWVIEHRAKLDENWQHAEAGEPLNKVPPLD